MEKRYAPFVAEIEALAGNRRRGADALFDAVRMMALSIESAVSLDARAPESEFKALRERHADAEYGHVTAAFAELVLALDADRTEFLGHVMERCFEATNTRNGQFLTPTNISSMMGDVLAGPPREDGGIVRLNDPSCGCGVLVIQVAEAFLAKGWRQADILIDAGDLDGRALDMCYVQLSLLGYAAVVRHQNALTRQYSGPTPVRYTPGWYLHGFPMRGISA